ncbi:RNA pseudouridine synthase [Olivibacter ginsenosidimutans]|uniref:RNA pseudouridine synthase n=1 Tax=Olivibacter ginsenosidimutans TaxID=1176537 RepID=A0ABP9CBA1_9SPHI
MPIAISDTIIYEDDHLIAINKPAGYLAETTKKKGEKTLVDLISNYLSVQTGKPVNGHAVHRLDRRVSGILLFSKTQEALDGMIALFKQRKVQKTYWAIVHEKPEPSEAVLIHWLTRDKVNNITFTHQEVVENSKKAELSYRIIAQANDYYLIEVNPRTGRTHQIRAQLAAIGCPIVGDYKYGYPRETPRKAIALHAKRLVFEHPISHEKIDLSIPKPNAQLWNSFDR